MDRRRVDVDVLGAGEHSAAHYLGSSRVAVMDVGGRWMTLDYSWMHYRGYLALLMIVVGSAGSGWIVARLHRDHQTAMVLAFLVALVLAAAAQLVIPVRLVGWPVRPMIHSAPTIIVLFVVTPISVLVGGLWTRLRHQHHRRPPERRLLAGRIEHGHLAVVPAGREAFERQREPERHGLRSRIEAVGRPAAAPFRAPSRRLDRT